MCVRAYAMGRIGGSWKMETADAVDPTVYEHAGCPLLLLPQIQWPQSLQVFPTECDTDPSLP